MVQGLEEMGEDCKYTCIYIYIKLDEINNWQKMVVSFVKF
jgi:hypothetical protein